MKKAQFSGTLFDLVIYVIWIIALVFFLFSLFIMRGCSSDPQKVTGIEVNSEYGFTLPLYLASPAEAYSQKGSVSEAIGWAALKNGDDTYDALSEKLHDKTGMYGPSIVRSGNLRFVPRSSHSYNCATLAPLIALPNPNIQPQPFIGCTLSGDFT